MARKKKPVFDEKPDDVEPTPATVQKHVSIALVPRHMQRGGKDLTVDGLIEVERAEIGGQDVTEQVSVETTGVLHWSARGSGFMEFYISRSQSLRVDIDGTFEVVDGD